MYHIGRILCTYFPARLIVAFSDRVFESIAVTPLPQPANCDASKKNELINVGLSVYFINMAMITVGLVSHRSDVNRVNLGRPPFGYHLMQWTNLFIYP